MNKKVKPDQPDKLAEESSARWFCVGFEFILVILAFTAVGYLLDRLGNTLPGFMVMFFIAGLAWMIYTLLKRSGYFEQRRRK
jgi:F0F1-type ATP synthase assembly protein I